MICESLKTCVTTNLLNSGLVAMLATIFCVWLLRPLAYHIGFVDRPGGRKHHEHNTPLIGGVAMFFGFCFSLLALGQSLHPYRGLIAGSSLLILMGVVDDFKELSSKLRLTGQFLAAIFLVAWGGKLVTNLGDLFSFGNIYLNLWAFPITILSVVGFINAMNMLDGQDGLAGGVALTQVLFLLILSVNLHLYSDVRMLIIITTLLAVFIGFNMRFPWRKKASIFMGDSGITFIAFLISWFAVDLSQSNVSSINPITILWILAFPLFDLIAVSLYRIRRGKSVLHASRDHFHHVLHLVGIDIKISTFLLCLLSLFFGAIGLLMAYFSVEESSQLIAFLIALVAYLTLVKLVRGTPAKKTLATTKQ